MRPHKIARTDAQVMMPGDGEGPENQTTENSLADGQGDDIAMAGEEPSHRRAADEGERYKNRIRPVADGEQSSS